MRKRRRLLRWSLIALGATLLAVLLYPGDLIGHLSAGTAAMPARVAAALPAPQTGLLRYLRWDDTLISLCRLSAGLALASAVALVLGFRPAAGGTPHALTRLPTLLLLPLLLLGVNAGSAALLLVAVGVLPALTQAVREVRTQIGAAGIALARSQGANAWTLLLRVQLPPLMPDLFAALRRSLPLAWLLLLAAEALAGNSGLGHALFDEHRAASVDGTLLCAAWIAVLALVLDALFEPLAWLAFPWRRSAA